MTTGKTTNLIIQTFVGRVIYLLFNMLYRLVIVFLLRSNCILISWLPPSAVILKLKKIKFVTVSTFPHLFAMKFMGLDAVILVFWILSLKSAFSLSSMTLIKRLFSFSSLSAIRVVSSAYLRLLILLPAILISAWDSSSLAFHMIYSAYSTCTQLNKQSENIQPWHTPFPILNQSIVSCLVNCRPADRFLRRQVKWFGIPNSLSIFHSLLWFTQSKAFT